MTRFLKGILPHILILLGFVVISLAYFSPVLQGKEIYQSDIVQYIGMSRQQNDYREQTGKETYWTDAAFGGMPTYQLGAHYPNNYIKKLDLALRFLPRPADYLFLYFLGFYILMLVLKLDYKLAFLGALAFGFSTYFIILLGVGHNSKAHAIAYMPVVLAGIILCFRNKYIWGFLLLAFGMALEIEANHFQMTYYLLLLVVVLGIVYLIDAYRKKQLPHYFKALGVMVGAVLLAVGTNATSILTTKEYTRFSTRGNTGLTINPEGKKEPASGLDYNYITEYSYGILETFNLFIPRFMGGSSAEKLGNDSNMYSQLLKMGASPAQAADFASHAPTYWGDQTYVGAPAYIGASVLFLFVFALFLIRGRLKWWIVAGSLLALFLSWGKNFAFLTHFFINYVPLYNKFRAVSSIQVIIELCVPILAIFGLYRLFNDFEKKEEKFYALKWATIITGGVALLFLLFKSAFFSFTGGNDAVYVQQMGSEFIRALKEDRKALFTSDTIRSLVFVLITAGLVWLYLKEKASKNLIIVGFVLLILADLMAVDKRYVNDTDFVAARAMKKPFQKTAADAQILQDTTHYRVFDLSGDPFNSGRASYFHNALGGYSAAKPGRMQDLYNFYISQNKMNILNMLNVKYFIIPSKKGSAQVQQNPGIYGNAWFASNIKWANSANEEILALDKVALDSTVVLNESYKDQVPTTLQVDSSAKIRLVQYEPNKLVYKSISSAKELAVFSEMYYPDGWTATVDGKDTNILNADYVLRALVIPAGKHTIEFKFNPQIVKTGSTISMASSAVLILLFLGGIFFTFKRKGIKEIT